MGSREGGNREKYEWKHEKISIRKIIKNTNLRGRKNTSIEGNHHSETRKFPYKSLNKIHETIQWIPRDLLEGSRTKQTQNAKITLRKITINELNPTTNHARHSLTEKTICLREENLLRKNINLRRRTTH